jgi:uncharacterized membrane protein YqaE (UPF0057 family)
MAKKKTNSLLLVIIAILLPPLAVYLAQNGVKKHFWINIILCIFFWIPGVLHALWVVLA